METKKVKALDLVGKEGVLVIFDPKKDWRQHLNLGNQQFVHQYDIIEHHDSETDSCGTSPECIMFLNTEGETYSVPPNTMVEIIEDHPNAEDYYYNLKKNKY
jgi:hypothetical protein